jgi:ankyrin repeat protein
MVQFKIFAVLLSILILGCSPEKKSTEQEQDEMLEEASVEVTNNEDTEAVSEEIDEGDYSKWDEKSLNEALLTAIENEDIQNTKKLILAGADVNYKPNWDSNTPLIMASQMGNLEMVKLLVENRAKPDLGSGEFENFRNPITVAIENGHLEVVKYFIKKGVDLNRQHPIWYVNFEDEQMFNYLVQEGMDMDAINSIDAEWEISFLSHALMKRNFEDLEFLISKGAKLSEELLWQVEDVEQVSFLKSKNFDFEAVDNQIKETTGEPSVNSILSWKNKEVIAMILKNGFIPNHNTLVNSFPPSCEFKENKEACIQEGNDKFEIILKAFLQKKENEINQNYEFHQWIVYPGITSQFSNNRTTLLNIAAFSGNISATKILIQYGADTNQKDEHGNLSSDFKKENKELQKILNSKN